MRKICVILLALLLTACSSAQPEAPKPTPKVQGCGDGDFSYSVGVTEGAAGTSYTTFIFENISDHECTLEGVPTAQPVGGESAEPIGPESKKNDFADRGDPVVLQPGQRASVMFAVATASNYPADECVAIRADGVSVTFDTAKTNLTKVFTLRGYEVCTEIPSTSISGVVAGVEG